MVCLGFVAELADAAIKTSMGANKPNN